MNTSHIKENTSDPFTYLSVGTWFLLKKVRREFALWLGKRSFEIRENNQDQLQELFEAVNHLKNRSRDQWQKNYSDKKFIEELQSNTTISADSPMIGHFSSLLDYLGKCDDFSSTSYEDKDRLLKQWVKWLEKLLMPYLSSIDHEFKVGIWFPPKRFLEKKYKEGGIKGDTLYPFFEFSIFNLMESQEKKDSLGARQEFSETMDIFDKLSKGISSFQSKIIGNFSLLAVPSKFIDKVVGNGSALLFKLEDDSDLLGMLCMSSPIFGLFHEMLILPSTRPKGLSTNYYDSVYICEKELGDYSLTIDDVENIDELTIIKCRCKEQAGVPNNCFYKDLISELGYLVLDYLKGIRQFRVQEKIENVAHIAHDFESKIPPLASYIHIVRKKIEGLSLETNDVYQTIRKAEELSEELVEEVLCIRSDTANYYGRPGSTEDIEAVVDYNLGLCIFLDPRTKEVKFEKSIIGNPRAVPGTKIEWGTILRYVLSNAFEATSPKDGCPEGYKPKVTVKLNFEGEDIFILELSNTVPWPIKREIVDMMQKLIDKKSVQMPNRGSKGTGKGIFFAGQLLARLKMKAEYYTEEGDSAVLLKIYSY